MQVWAPVIRAGEADGGLSASWLPVVDSRGGLVDHMPGNLVGGAGQVLRDGRGRLQVRGHAAASLLRAGCDRVGRDGGVLVVLPEDLAPLAAARRFVALGAAFGAAQRGLSPRVAVLLPFQLVGDGNAPAARGLGQDQEAADAAVAEARARAQPEEEARRDGDHDAAPQLRARAPQQQPIAPVISYSPIPFFADWRTDCSSIPSIGVSFAAPRPQDY